MDSHLLNKKNMAESLGISTQAFDKWGVKPHKKVGRQTFFRVQDVVENRIENELKKNNNRVNPAGEKIDLELERAMLTQQQRITQQIKNEILEGRAIPVEAARDVLARILLDKFFDLDRMSFYHEV